MYYFWRSVTSGLSGIKTLYKIFIHKYLQNDLMEGLGIGLREKIDKYRLDDPKSWTPIGKFLSSNLKTNFRNIRN